MAEKIKGITVEIGGDTVGLQSALKDVNKASRSLYGELQQVNRMLELDPGNVDLLAQRTQILNETVETTEKKLAQMKSVYSQVEDQFKRGDIGADQWRRFQREIIQTEQRLEGFQSELQETEQVAERSGKEISSSLGSALAGAVAGAGAATVLEKAMSSAGLETQIKVAFDVDEAAIPAVKEIITGITNMGIEGEAAIEGVRKQLALNNDLTLEQNQKIVEQAGVIARSYSDIDFTELINESNEFAEALGIGQEEALAMTNHLLKMGFPPDQIDILAEYGSQMQRAGYTAQEIQGIFAAGVETKSWNIDVLLDGVKEGRIVLAEFSEGVDKATSEMIAGTSISADELKNWGSAVAAGGEEGKIAFGQVALELSKIEDEGKRNAIGAKLFGTLWEEQGKKITESMAGAASKTGDLKQNTDEMNAALAATKADPQVRLNTALGEMNKSLTPLLTSIAEFVAKVADWVAKNPELAATVVAVATGLGILLGIFAALAPIISAIIAAAAFFGTTVAALSAPILIVVGVIAALIAIIVLLWKNWDEVSTWWKAGIDKINAAIEQWVADVKQRFNEQVQSAKDMVAKINKAFQDWKDGVKKRFNEAIDDIKTAWNNIMEFFKGIDLKQIGRDIISGLINGIGEMKDKLERKARDIAGSIGKKLKSVLEIGSPSKVTMEIGKWTGEGLVEGLQQSVSKVQDSAVNLANNVVQALGRSFNDKDNALIQYFEAIQEDGDWLNDWLTHMPKQVANVARELGKFLAPDLEGTKAMKAANDVSWSKAKSLTVNIQSPKALDVREANREFNRTMNRMTMQW